MADINFKEYLFATDTDKEKIKRKDEPYRIGWANVLGDDGLYFGYAGKWNKQEARELTGDERVKLRAWLDKADQADGLVVPTPTGAVSRPAPEQRGGVVASGNSEKEYSEDTPDELPPLQDNEVPNPQETGDTSAQEAYDEFDDENEDDTMTEQADTKTPEKKNLEMAAFQSEIRNLTEQMSHGMKWLEQNREQYEKRLGQVEGLLSQVVEVISGKQEEKQEDKGVERPKWL